MEFKEYLMEDALAAIIDYRGKTPQKSESGVPTLSAKSVKNNYINYAECYHISKAEYKRFMVRGFPQKGDILLTTEAPMGMVARLDRENIAIAQRLLTLRGKEGILDNDYLLYLLQSPYGQGLLKAKETGTTVTGIKQSEFRRIVIKLPDFAVQKKVSSVLNAIDSKISCNTKINDNLQQQLFSLYEKIAMTSPCSKEDTLSNLCDFQEGYVNPAQTHPEFFDGEVKWLRAVDINESFITETSRTLTRAGFESAKKSALLFKPNTIAISKSGTIGRLGIVADYMCGNRAVINIAPHNSNMLAFIYCFLKSKQREFPNMAVGSVQKNLYVSLLEPLSVSMPDDESLTTFNAVGASILDMIHNNCVENTKLANLRDTILPKMMSGEIDVSDIQL